MSGLFGLTLSGRVNLKSRVKNLLTPIAQSIANSFAETNYQEAITGNNYQEAISQLLRGAIKFDSDHHIFIPEANKNFITHGIVLTISR